MLYKSLNKEIRILNKLIFIHKKVEMGFEPIFYRFAIDRLTARPFNLLLTITRGIYNRIIFAK